MDGKLFRKTPKKKNSKHSLLTLSSLQGTKQFVPYKTYALKLSNILIFLYYLPYFIKNIPLCPTSYIQKWPQYHSTWFIVMVFRKGLFADVVCRLVSFLDTLILPVKSPSVATQILQPPRFCSHCFTSIIFQGSQYHQSSLVPQQAQLPRLTKSCLGLLPSSHTIQAQGIFEQTSRFPKQTTIPLF